MKKVEELYHKIMRQLYAEATPPLDWDELYNSSEEVKKKFNFRDHYLDADRMSEIIEATLKKSKLPKHIKDGIEFNVVLGCAPSTKEPK